MYPQNMAWKMVQYLHLLDPGIPIDKMQAMVCLSINGLVDVKNNHASMEVNKQNHALSFWRLIWPLTSMISRQILINHICCLKLFDLGLIIQPTGNWDFTKQKNEDSTKEILAIQ